MTIEILPDRYFVAFWFMTNKKDFDVLGALYRDPGQPWVLRYRMRDYKDEKVFDSADEKSWYEVSHPAELSEDAAATLAELTFQMASCNYGGVVQTIPIKSNDPFKVTMALAACPFTHVQNLNAPQA